MTTGQTLDAVVTGQDYVLLNYTITQGSAAVEAPSFSPAAGTYSSAQSVTISTGTSGATIKYTTDGSTPGQSNGTVYSSAISVAQNTTLKAMAYKSGMTDSSVTSGDYVISCEAPSFSPAAGSYTSVQSVTIASGTGGASIRYTTDGTAPTSSTGTVYYSAVTIDQNCTLKAIAYKSGMGDSSVTSGGYTIALPCADPSFSPAAGTYTSAQSVTITSSTSGASIRYTTDGSTPSDTAGTVYSGAVSITGNCTLKAIAYKSGLGNGNVTSGADSYLIGNNTVGGSNQSTNSGTMYAGRFQSPGSFTASNIYVDIATSASGKNIKCAIYSDSSGNPGSLLMGTIELTNPGTGWKTFSLTSGQALTGGTYYWLVIWDNGSFAVKGDSSGGTYKYKTQTYGTWPSSFGTPTGSGAIEYSIYAQ